MTCNTNLNILLYFKKDILQNILNFLSEDDFKNMLYIFSKNKFLKEELKYILYKNLVNFNNNNIEYYNNTYNISFEKIILKKNIDNNVILTIKNSFINLKILYFLINSYDSYIINIVKYCKELKTLSLIGNSNITDIAIDCISQNCLKLENIYLNYCEKITYKSINNLLKSCKYLKNIEFSGKDVNDYFLINISENCVKLESLNLKYCNNITDLSISALFKNKLKLKHIDLTCCEYITENSITNIAKKCNNLESIILQNCININNNGIINLINYCNNLKSINLIGCNLINIDSVSLIFSTCKKLENISLFGKNQINDNILINIKENKLNEIYFNSIFGITENGLINFIKKSHFLEKIKIPKSNIVTDLVLHLLTFQTPIIYKPFYK